MKQLECKWRKGYEFKRLTGRRDGIYYVPSEGLLVAYYGPERGGPPTGGWSYVDGPEHSILEDCLYLGPLPEGEPSLDDEDRFLAAPVDAEEVLSALTRTHNYLTDETDPDRLARAFARSVMELREQDDQERVIDTIRTFYTWIDEPYTFMINASLRERLMISVRMLLSSLIQALVEADWGPRRRAVESYIQWHNEQFENYDNDYYLIDPDFVEDYMDHVKGVQDE